jgi:hypothetical protein
VPFQRIQETPRLPHLARSLLPLSRSAASNVSKVVKRRPLAALLVKWGSSITATVVSHSNAFETELAEDRPVTQQSRGRDGEGSKIPVVGVRPVRCRLCGASAEVKC